MNARHKKMQTKALALYHLSCQPLFFSLSFPTFTYVRLISLLFLLSAGCISFILSASLNLLCHTIGLPFPSPLSFSPPCRWLLALCCYQFQRTDPLTQSIVDRSKIRCTTHYMGSPNYSVLTFNLFCDYLQFCHFTVSLGREPVGASICPGDLVTFTCAVDTGILMWQDGDGNTLGSSYFASTSPGTIQTVNGFTFNLTSVSGNNLISTATIRPVTSGMVTLQCTNAEGGTNRSTVAVRSSMCRYVSLIYCGEQFRENLHEWVFSMRLLRGGRTCVTITSHVCILSCIPIRIVYSCDMQYTLVIRSIRIKRLCKRSSLLSTKQVIGVTGPIITVGHRSFVRSKCLNGRSNNVCHSQGCGNYALKFTYYAIPQCSNF